MKKYIQLDMNVLTLNKQDIVTASGFWGNEEDTDGFGNPADPDLTHFED